MLIVNPRMARMRTERVRFPVLPARVRATERMVINTIAVNTQCSLGAHGSLLFRKGQGVQRCRWNMSEMYPENGLQREALKDCTAANVPAATPMEARVV